MLFSSFWKRGPGPPLWGPGGVLGPLDPPLDPPQNISQVCHRTFKKAQFITKLNAKGYNQT